MTRIFEAGPLHRAHHSVCSSVASVVLLLSIVTSAAAQNVKVNTAQVHQDRLMKDVAAAFETHTNASVELWRPYKPVRKWPVMTDRVEKNGHQLQFTSREDWTYRADKADRQNLRYVPFVQQIAHRNGTEVGSVEYGLLIRKDHPDPVAKRFLDFLKTEHVQEIVERPDPYLYVPLDREVTDFEAPGWYPDEQPNLGPGPAAWHGESHIWNNEYHGTMLAELKLMWMAGFNQATGVRMGEELTQDAPLLEWALDHNFMIAGLPAKKGQKHVDQIKRIGDHPAVVGSYYQNEDFLSRVYIPLYEHLYKLEAGEADEAIKGVSAVRRQFPDWLKQKHGRLDTLNERWDTSYDSWNQIGFPELPLDWVQRIYNRTGYKSGDLSKAELTKTFFHEPLHFHALADDPALLDFQRYMRQAWARKYKALDPNHGADQLWSNDFTNHAEKLEPVTGHGTFYYTTKTRLNPYLFREVEEFNSAGFTHMINTVPPHFVQVVADTTYLALDKPLWNAEHHLYNHGSATPRKVRYHVLHSNLMGMLQSSAYNRQTNYKSGRPDKAGFYHKAVRGPHYRAEVSAHTQIRRHRDAFRAFVESRADADISVLVNEGNRGWNLLPDHPARPELGGAVRAYGYVSVLGKPWKYVLAPDVSAKHCTDTLIVDAPWLTEHTAERIVDLPGDRRIIAVDELPTTNEYGQPLPEATRRTLNERATVVDEGKELKELIEPVPGLGGPFTDMGKGSFWFWGQVAGRKNFTTPTPQLEVRHVQHNGNLLVAVANHRSDREITAELPWASGHNVRELTTNDPRWQMYPPGKHIRFTPYSVRVFEIQNGRVPVTFWRYEGKGKGAHVRSLGENLEDAVRNENMGINHHWKTARPEDHGKRARSLWRIPEEDDSRHIRHVTITSEVTVKKGKDDRALAILEWARNPDGPWRTLFRHRAEPNTDSWSRDHRTETLTLDSPAEAVYLRMTFPPSKRGVMWRKWTVRGRTVQPVK